MEGCAAAGQPGTDWLNRLLWCLLPDRASVADRGRRLNSVALREDHIMARFAAIGLDHRHIYDLTAGLLAAGATCVGYDPVSTDPRVLEGFRKRSPDVPAAERERLL